ncbi:MAG: SDR family NAD(P)-dependent oxidoreductase [Anaerolineae bacterium]|nr:SDR family NAD(P)-dependent oxidoreductase [Anaerolineae bacterium]
MQNTAFVTGADRGLGLALCAELLARGWRVLAGQYMPEWVELGELAAQYPESLHLIPLDVGSTTSVQAAAQTATVLVDQIDLLINNAGIGGGGGELGKGLDFAAMQWAFSVNALGGIRMVEAFLPLMAEGMRRLCFVSSEAGCISLAHRQGGFGYGMSKSALNMAVRIMFNDLHPQGYTFRLYHPGWMRSYMRGVKSTHGDIEPEESAAQAIPFFLNDLDDEGRLALIDYEGKEWPF